MDFIIQEKIIPSLIERGFLSQSVADRVIKEAEAKRIPILTILCRDNLVEEHELEKILRQILKFPVVDPMAGDIPNEIISIIDITIAKKYHCIPVKKDGELVQIAIDKPYDIVRLDDLRIILNAPVKPMLALYHKIDKAIKKYYEDHEVVAESDGLLEDIIKEVESEDLEVVEKPNDEELNTILHSAEETPVIKLANFILAEGIKRHASDIFIEPWEKHMTVRCRVDGLLEEMKSPPRSMAHSIVSRLKVMSNLDIAERRMPQDGRMKIKFHDRFVDLRISVIPSSYGEKVCLRILDKTAQTQSMENLGFNEDELERIREAARHPHGMMLVTGPTGSGKTTTLYSVLGYLDSPEKNITTVEDPVEYQLYGINQVNIREPVGLTFPASLRSILRQDPDIIMIGEIRDFTTMDIAIKAALTGHLVLSTLHTNDASGSIVRITNMGIEPFLIASSVLMISAQRLVRRLCNDCKDPYEPSKEVLKRLNLPEDKEYTFYKHVGCESCRQSGFKGRTVITEVLPVSPAIRELIMQKATGDEIKRGARKEGMHTLRESGVRKIMAGESSVDEIFRVTAADQALD